MLAIDGERCLLGRSARFPGSMWSCLAGFVEPGESIEEAVRRETLEEAGVASGRVRYYASQPWPFPMSLMIGCFAEATGTALKIDRAELEDGRWFLRAEAALMLARKHPDGLFTPPPIAIAHHLIRAYVERGADVLA
jgi:NAD+ diphosphatase